MCAEYVVRSVTTNARAQNAPTRTTRDHSRFFNDALRIGRQRCGRAAQALRQPREICARRSTRATELERHFGACTPTTLPSRSRQGDEAGVADRGARQEHLAARGL